MHFHPLDPTSNFRFEYTDDPVVSDMVLGDYRPVPVTIQQAGLRSLIVSLTNLHIALCEMWSENDELLEKLESLTKVTLSLLLGDVAEMMKFHFVLEPFLVALFKAEGLKMGKLEPMCRLIGHKYNIDLNQYRDTRNSLGHLFQYRPEFDKMSLFDDTSTIILFFERLFESKNQTFIRMVADE